MSSQRCMSSRRRVWEEPPLSSCSPRLMSIPSGNEPLVPEQRYFTHYKTSFGETARDRSLILSAIGGEWHSTSATFLPRKLHVRQQQCLASKRGQAIDERELGENGLMDSGEEEMIEQENMPPDRLLTF